MKRGIKIMAGTSLAVAALLSATAPMAADWSGSHADAPIDVRDPWLKAWIAVTPDNPPKDPVPGVD